MIFVTGLGKPEGPVLLPDASWALVEMDPQRGCITHIDANGKTRRVIAKTGRPNGLAIDRNGILWVAESVNPPSLLRVTMDGKAEVVMTECNGEPFLFPNDLCFGPDGALYMTDSGFSAKKWMTFSPEQKRNTKTDGRIYRIEVKKKIIEKLDSAIPFANGIAFGPDGNLYVSATRSGMIYCYRCKAARLGQREDFASVLNPEMGDAYRGPDGMAFDENGNLYVAVVWQGDVTVIDPDGKTIRRIPLAGKGPTNVAFGPPGSKKIYVTEQSVGQFEVHDVGADGMPLFN
ncbi:MAG: SMP-30/gluconolactonase/LRE family protein [Deltaproteobacteria bacterium]|nr:SMP-30/gluconolactonase/LRE family protein [Deltaproteobacteria bacterium]MBW2151711.1 SMP-30/gluconolactonase/LRE family protein [Deltaproteobacteria bacterium]